ncbi:MAG TPA: alpha-galactosidase [Actinomycetota bacterium]
MALLGLIGPASADANPAVTGNAGVTATIDDAGVSLTNGVVTRTWRGDALATTAITGPGFSSNAETPDFRLGIAGLTVPSDLLVVTGVGAAPVEGGVRITWDLLLPGVAGLTREVEAYGDVAGFRSRTTVDALTPVVLEDYSLDEVGVGTEATATIHEFRAGADWRFDDGWNPAGIGEAHKGDWRVEHTGSDVDANGEWMSVETGAGARVAMVMERRNYASSVMSLHGGVASARVDLGRDVVYIGPFEETAHVENPAAQGTEPGVRARVLSPGEPLTLETVFTALAEDADREPWEFYKYLTRHRLTPYPKAVTFNTNGVDANLISTGAKDDVNFERLQSLADAAREMGVETFVLDDGWQARSGDWCPDSADCTEPRWDGSAESKFRPRFPDDTFDAVGDELAGEPGPEDDMALGLWWTPMEFNPASAAFSANPQWACGPVGHGLAVYNALQPDSSSNEAGLGVWNPLAMGLHPDTGQPMRLIDYMRDRLTRAIEVYGARYFKFDFLAWVDCAGVHPADMYTYHDAFVAMVDRLQAAHPEVTYQVDETNDYRMFPFESVARGPSWFQNGKPEIPQLLHNIWKLAPYVPGFSLGQHAASNNGERATLAGLLGSPEAAIDAAMAAALGSHITFWNEIDAHFTTAERAHIKVWTDFYKAHRDGLAGFAYPLLDDPLGGGWTALQPWNPETGEGYLLAYRQGSADADRAIPLRGVPDGTYTVTRIDPATSPGPAATLTAAELRSGVDVHLPSQWGHAILRIEPQ